MRRRKCQICDRTEGSTKDRGGDEDGVPLGPVTKCDTCGRWACPDCEAEADCCFVEVEDHANDPTWAPPGWRVSKYSDSGVEYERTGSE
jgi:hypothetical protein